MKRQIGAVSVASAVTASLLLIITIAGLALPVRGQGMDGPLGADCILMAQALRGASQPYRVIASDRTCRWRELGLPRALAYDHLPPGIDAASRTVEAPRYSLGGYRAEVDVGVSLAALAGSGQNCTYYRFWGTWHRAGCVESWVA